MISKSEWIKKILVCISILNGRAITLISKISLYFWLSMYLKLKLRDMAIGRLREKTKIFDPKNEIEASKTRKNKIL